MRYDAAVIGAGTEGLAAAALLGRAGLRVLVIERGEHVGGRAVVREFHPGYRASPFVDALAPVPLGLFWELDLARHGAQFAPPEPSLALWPDRQHRLGASDSAASSLLATAEGLRQALVARAASQSERQTRRRQLFRKPAARPWPASDWATQSLCDVVERRVAEPDGALHVIARATGRRAADPALPGSALHLLDASAPAGRLPGGPARLADALLAIAKAHGAKVSLGLEATDIRRKSDRVVGVGLADGSEIETPCVISTLDIKRTFLGFFSWNALPVSTVRKVRAFRLGGSTARVLLALGSAPDLPDAARAGAAIHVAPSLEQLGAAWHACRSGTLAEHLPATLRLVSAGEPSFAPPSGAVVSATVGAVPFRLFDGAWTHEKRALLAARVAAAIERVVPGFAACVVGTEVIVPSDIEDALGATEGDLDGGEIDGEQLLGEGPWGEPAMPRTPVRGLYMAGSYLAAGAFATCAAGAAAARAVLADRAGGRKR